MGRADYLELGDWNAVCYRCGFKRKAKDLVREWEGFYVCHSCFEMRHSQDFVRGVQDIQMPPWTQPMPTDQFIGFCTPNGISDVIGTAVVGCAIVGFVSPLYDPNNTSM
jgi:hypothetical protein